MKLRLTVVSNWQAVLRELHRAAYWVRPAAGAFPADRRTGAVLAGQ
jgi:hypothetical protein